VAKDALGTIKEAEIHYDIDNPPWVARMTSKTYSPGQGMAFGLGKSDLLTYLQSMSMPAGPACTK